MVPALGTAPVAVQAVNPARLPAIACDAESGSTNIHNAATPSYGIEKRISPFPFRPMVSNYHWPIRG
jgi:hypothetical protein